MFIGSFFHIFTSRIRSNRPELNFIVKLTQSTEEKINDILNRIMSQRQSTPDDALIVFMPLTGKDPNQTNWDWWCQEERRLQKRHSFQVTLFASFLEEELGERVCLYHGKMDENEEHSDAPEPRQSTVPPLGNLSGRYRKGEQLAFIRGERAIMVATKGFGMGIDKPNIRLVIHRTPPGNLEAYIRKRGEQDGMATSPMWCSTLVLTQLSILILQNAQTEAYRNTSSRANTSEGLM